MFTTYISNGEEAKKKRNARFDYPVVEIEPLVLDHCRATGVIGHADGYIVTICESRRASIAPIFPPSVKLRVSSVRTGSAKMIVRLA